MRKEILKSFLRKMRICRTEAPGGEESVRKWAFLGDALPLGTNAAVLGAQNTRASTGVLYGPLRNPSFRTGILSNGGFVL